MADLYSDFVTPAELTGYARDALDEAAENEFRLAAFLPNQNIDDLRYRLEQGPQGLLDVADYRAFDAEPTFGRREGIKSIEGSLPPMGRQMTLGEYDVLIMRNAEEKVRDLLLRDAEKIAKIMGRRMEVARADALVNASVTIGSNAAPENGLSLTVDFNRSSTHEVTAATVWSDLDDSNILDEMLAWRDVYQDTNGRMPGAILTSERVVRLMLRNEQVRDAIAGTNPGVRVRRADLADLLSDEGLPPIYTYEARKTAIVAGVRTTSRIIPDHKFLYLPEPVAPNGGNGDMGTSLWGSTVESQLPDYGIEPGEEPGVVVGAFIERKTPVRVDTIGAAIGLPVMVAPNLSFVADVVAAA